VTNFALTSAELAGTRDPIVTAGKPSPEILRARKSLQFVHVIVT
jgi:hypothetical protein